MCRRRVAVAQTWAARRAPCAGTWFSWHLVTSARGLRCGWVMCCGAGLLAPSRGPDGNVVPEPPPFVVPPGCVPEGRWRDACGLGRAGLGRASAVRCWPPPSVRLRRRCRFSAVGCPSRRSRAAPRPPPGVSGDQVLPAQRQRASPVPGVFAVLGRGCAPSSTQSWARVSRLCGGEWGRQIGQWCWLLGLSASVSLFIIAFGEISQVWLRKGVFFQLRSRSFSFLSGILN